MAQTNEKKYCSSKEEEKKMLKKIQKLIDSLGQESYIGTAFYGAFQLAETNIENDWGISTQSYIDECATNGLEQRQIEIRLEEQKDLKEDAERRLDELRTEYFEVLERDESIKKDLRAQKLELEQDLQQQQEEIVTLKDIYEQQQEEIVKLKVRLFDLTDK